MILGMNVLMISLLKMLFSSAPCSFIGHVLFDLQKKQKKNMQWKCNIATVVCLRQPAEVKDAHQQLAKGQNGEKCNKGKFN